MSGPVNTDDTVWTNETLAKQIENLPGLLGLALAHEVKAWRAYETARLEVERVRAVTELEVREAAKETGEKLNESAVKARTDSDDAVADAEDVLFEKEAALRVTRAQVEIERQRAKCADLLVKLQVGGVG